MRFRGTEPHARNPLACRALLARGITGRIGVCRPGRLRADLQLDTEKSAGLTISETDTRGLHPMICDFEPKNSDRIAGEISLKGRKCRE
jgi:hypothetical protein